MKYSFVVFLILLFVLFSLTSCSDDPSSIGINLLQQDYVVSGTYDTKDNPIEQSSSSYEKVIPLSLSTKILIGRRVDTEASTLMTFVFIINDSLNEDFLNDNITVSRAYIELTPKYTYTDETADFDFSVHKITSDWSISGFTSDSLINLTYDNLDLSSNKNFTDSIYTFDLNTDFISSWIKSTIDTSLGKNRGIYYKPSSNSGKVVGFQALTESTEGSPKLSVIFEKAGVFVDTISAILIGDVSAVSSDYPDIPAGDIFLQASTSIQAKLLFNLENLPKNIAINKTELILTEDEANSITGTSFNTNLSLFRIIDSSNVTIDGNNGVVLTKSDGVYAGDITSMMNYWMKYNDNQGVVIRVGSLIEGLELFAIKGSDNSNLSERPRLRITYSGKEIQN